MIRYTLIDHTADLGIRVFGDDLKQLFIRTGLAMFDLITDIGKLQKQEEVKVVVKGEDWPDLMVVWLRELLYIWYGKEMLVQSIEIESIGKFQVGATVGCIPYEAGFHEIKHDIKAVTYHQIEVAHTSRGWTSSVIFDV